MDRLDTSKVGEITTTRGRARARASGVRRRGRLTRRHPRAGRTSVIVAVHGPMKSKYKKNELDDRAYVEVIVEPAVGRQSTTEKEYQKVIRRIFERVIVTSKFPRMAISIVIQIVVDDGSLLSAAINGSCLALMDAGIEMTCTVASLTCVVDDTVLLDPQRCGPLGEEEGTDDRSHVCVTLSSTVNGKKERGILSSTTTGTMTTAEYFRGLDAVKSAVDTIFAFYRMKMRQHYTGTTASA